MFAGPLIPYSDCTRDTRLYRDFNSIWISKMATNFGQIRDQLTDFNSFGLMTTLIPPPPEVQQCWQWNTDSSEVQLRTNSGNLLRIPSGCPIFDQELQGKYVYLFIAR